MVVVVAAVVGQVQAVRVGRAVVETAVVTHQLAALRVQ
jgi:hypothetical protein